jgi:ribonuclease Z
METLKQKHSKILVIGSGEAFDTDLGNTSYLFRGKGLPTVLFDCGYQIPERLWKADLHTELDAVCLTHLHADHSFGIVPLLVRFGEEGRKTPLHIVGPRGTERFVTRLLEMGYPGFSKRLKFKIHHLTLSPRSALDLMGLTLNCAATVHSVLNYTIRVDLFAEETASFAISGDGQITPATKKLTANVDVLFQELYSDKPGIPVHADLKTVATWIKSTQIKTIVTSHFSRSRKAALEGKITSPKKGSTQWIISRPGLEVQL